MNNIEELDSWHHCWLLFLQENGYCLCPFIKSLLLEVTARPCSQHTLMCYTSTFGCAATYSHPSLGPISAALGFQQGNMPWDRWAPQHAEKPGFLSENSRLETSPFRFFAAINVLRQLS